MPSTAWHAQFEDVNNDGLIDLFIAKGNVTDQPDYARRDPSNLLLGQPDGTFREAADAAGILTFDRGRGAALVDLSLDGLLDIVEVNYGAPVRIWRNVGTGTRTSGRNGQLAGAATGARTAECRRDWCVDRGPHRRARASAASSRSAAGTPVVNSAGPTSDWVGRQCRGSRSLARRRVWSMAIRQRQHLRDREARRERMSVLTVRRETYPLVLPNLRDPRLHVAAVIITVHVFGQVGLHFAVSVWQILAAILTCAALEVAITFQQKRAIVWPASAMLTGSGIGLILRVVGTPADDHWSTYAIGVFAVVAGLALLSKYAFRYREAPLFNPSNVALVGAFLLLGSSRVEPLDFWWTPPNAWLVAAYAVILTGGLLITRRLHLTSLAASFWLTLTAGLGCWRHQDTA